MGAAEGNLAWVARRLGQPEAARAHAVSALDYFRPSLQNNPLVWIARWPLLALDLKAGELPAAVEHAQAMLAPHQKRQPEAVMAGLEEAVAAWEAGDAERAGRRLQAALESAEPLGYC
jgi:hypothetical protein